MFGLLESLLPNLSGGQGVISVGFEKTDLEELEGLLSTLGVEVHKNYLFAMKRINPATYIGKGRLEEIRESSKVLNTPIVVFDAELSPNQLRNLEKILGCAILDRSSVIIEIFSRHARTKESKTQVELAKLQYLLPRMAHFWTHFERQRGGIGLKGMGEKQIEVDRRLLQKRIALLKRRLTSIEKERRVQRSGRKDLLKVALVGYTNAGKSTLLNALTKSDLRAEDKLFATLDSHVRALDPTHHPPIVAIDTVGFINRIPPTLIASFRSTLEELHIADVLVHVVDASSQEARDQFETTEKFLQELGLNDKLRIVVANKMDLVQTHSDTNRVRTSVPGAMRVSSFNSGDIERLKNKIYSVIRDQLELWQLVLPYSESKLEARIHALGRIEKTRFLEKGTFFQVRISSAWAKKLKLNRFRGKID